MFSGLVKLLIDHKRRLVKITTEAILTLLRIKFDPLLLTNHLFISLFIIPDLI